jgi:xylose isomerase
VGRCVSGKVLFHVLTRFRGQPSEVIERLAGIGIGWWTMLDTDIIPTTQLMTGKQDEILAGIGQALKKNGVNCSMVPGEIFFHPVWAASPASGQSEVRAYTQQGLENVVGIACKLTPQFIIYWPGTLGHQFQGVVDESLLLLRSAEEIHAACENDLAVARITNTPTMRHSLEAKLFEPQSELILRTTDAMLAFINSGLLAHPEMVGVTPEYLHELMWGRAPRAASACALVAGKLWHFDVNDGYRLKHDVDIGIGLVNPLDGLNVLILFRSHGYNGPFNLDFKPPRTVSNHGIFRVGFLAVVDRFITLWEIAGEAMSDPIIQGAT